MIITELSDALTTLGAVVCTVSARSDAAVVVSIGRGGVPKWRREANALTDTPAALEDLFSRPDRRGR